MKNDISTLVLATSEYHDNLVKSGMKKSIVKKYIEKMFKYDFLKDAIIEIYKRNHYFIKDSKK